MSGYDGQESNGAYRRVAIDGPYIFHEGLFRACTALVKNAAVPPENIVHELQALATQEPPSHLAINFLGKLGIGVRMQPDHYDAVVCEGWKLEGSGYSILADIVTQQQGVKLAIFGDR